MPFGLSYYFQHSASSLVDFPGKYSSYVNGFHSFTKASLLATLSWLYWFAVYCLAIKVNPWWRERVLKVSEADSPFNCCAEFKVRAWQINQQLTWTLIKSTPHPSIHLPPSFLLQNICEINTFIVSHKFIAWRAGSNSGRLSMPSRQIITISWLKMLIDFVGQVTLWGIWRVFS